MRVWVPGLGEERYRKWKGEEGEEDDGDDEDDIGRT